MSEPCGHDGDMELAVQSERVFMRCANCDALVLDVTERIREAARLERESRPKGDTITVPPELLERSKRVENDG